MPQQQHDSPPVMSSSQQSSISGQSLEPISKRQKVRKGTFSCWECKRRKTKCSLTSRHTAEVCDGCRRRGAACISQEYPDVQREKQDSTDRTIIERLDRMEALIERLVTTVTSQNVHGDISRSSSLPSMARSRQPRTRDEDQSIPDQNWPTPRPKSRVERCNPARHRAWRKMSVPRELTCNSRGIADELLQLWPVQRDLDIITSLSVEPSIEATLRGLSSHPDSSGIQHMLKVPKSPGCHPTVLTRKSLVLAIYVQGTLSSSTQEFARRCGDSVANAVEVAHRLVTSNDELVGCCDGIECLFIESLYHNYTGNLQAAWLASRRAVTMAQMLRVHQGVTPPSLTSDAFNPENMWFRILQLDRYLSMTLGLPQSSLDNSFADPDSLRCCGSLERMQRLTCVAGSRIMQRKAADLDDLSIAWDIDQLLRDASASMTQQWWLPPSLKPGHGTLPFDDAAQYMDHFSHYYLIVQLHLPYILRPSNDQGCIWNKMAAVSASREILARFVSFRTSMAVDCYCPGVDQLAFVSSATLCLAHICAFEGIKTKSSEYTTGFLSSQRLTDRGMLERAVEAMNSAEDPVTSNFSTVMQHLLTIETAVSMESRRWRCSIESFSVVSIKESEPACRGWMSDDGETLQLFIPYIGIIKLEHLAEPSASIYAEDCRANFLDVENEIFEVEEGLDTQVINSGDRMLSMLDMMDSNDDPEDWAFMNEELGPWDGYLRRESAEERNEEFGSVALVV